VEGYKQLIAWQKAMNIVLEVYRLTATFPGHESYGLTNQLRRAAVSIPSNIAEGQGRGRRDFARHLRIANGSRQEVETQLVIAARLGYIEQASGENILQQISELGRILTGLRRSLTSKDDD
jgi:four helix bundle protein